MSGSPIINENGELVAVNAAVLDQKYYLGIPAKTLLEFLKFELL
jgi:S1-C subfamily serine protease